jgi:hypothetical protein
MERVDSGAKLGTTHSPQACFFFRSGYGGEFVRSHVKMAGQGRDALVAP